MGVGPATRLRQQWDNVDAQICTLWEKMAEKAIWFKGDFEFFLFFCSVLQSERWYYICLAFATQRENKQARALMLAQTLALTLANTALVLEHSSGSHPGGEKRDRD